MTIIEYPKKSRSLTPFDEHPLFNCSAGIRILTTSSQNGQRGAIICAEKKKMETFIIHERIKLLHRTDGGGGKVLGRFGVARRFCGLCASGFYARTADYNNITIILYNVSAAIRMSDVVEST
ncbi:hypothetical protein QTP88_018200 [Uroleucon formosanum]